jgi:hypothetical protein
VAEGDLVWEGAAEANRVAEAVGDVDRLGVLVGECNWPRGEAAGVLVSGAVEEAFGLCEHRSSRNGGLTSNRHQC